MGGGGGAGLAGGSDWDGWRGPCAIVLCGKFNSVLYSVQITYMYVNEWPIILYNGYFLQLEIFTIWAPKRSIFNFFNSIQPQK